MLYKLRRRILSQNFLYNRTLIKDLVRRSSLASNDICLEIGPGKGFITSELLKICKKVVAIEIDPKLVLHLQRFFCNEPKLDLYLANILDFPLPDFNYKVFANIPFSIEGEIIRDLIDAKNPPDDCYLVVRQDLAERLSGNLHDNQFSLKHKPWFDFEIVYYFKRSDFIPRPNVDSVLWRIKKKESPLLSAIEKERYQHFIELGFGHGEKVSNNLSKIISKQNLIQLKQNLSFSIDNKPGSITFKQWLTLYSFCKSC